MKYVSVTASVEKSRRSVRDADELACDTATQCPLKTKSARTVRDATSENGGGSQSSLPATMTQRSKTSNSNSEDGSLRSLIDIFAIGGISAASDAVAASHTWTQSLRSTSSKFCGSSINRLLNVCQRFSIKMTICKLSVQQQSDNSRCRLCTTPIASTVLLSLPIERSIL